MPRTDSYVGAWNVSIHRGHHSRPIFVARIADLHQIEVSAVYVQWVGVAVPSPSIVSHVVDSHLKLHNHVCICVIAERVSPELCSPGRMNSG